MQIATLIHGEISIDPFEEHEVTLRTTKTVEVARGAVPSCQLFRLVTAKFIIFHTKVLVFHTKFILFTHPAMFWNCLGGTCSPQNHHDFKE